METIFYANNTENANSINAIAVDLGKTDFSEFEDDKECAVKKLNSITENLVSSGILNTLNNCTCSYTDGKIIIDTGIIVFSDGAKIKINTAVELEPILTSETNYVYAVNNSIENKAYLEVRTEALSSGDYILLCQLAGGVITDKRNFAKAKVNFPTEANSYSATIHLSADTVSPVQYKFNVAGIKKIFFSDFSNASETNKYIVEYDPINRFYCGFPCYNHTTRKGIFSYNVGYCSFNIRESSSYGSSLTCIIKNDVATITMSSYWETFQEDININIYFFGGI